MNKRYYKWKQLDLDVKSIISIIKDKKWNIKAVYGVPKGGLILGVILANILDVLLYTNIRRVQGSILTPDEVLIVDDISDTGKTLIGIKDITSYKTITLYIKEGTKFMPDIHLHKCKKDEWITFAWEENEYLKEHTSKCERDNTDIKKG